MSRWRIRRLEITSSTNDEAKAAASSGEPEGLVVWAKQQTRGRGRQGRQWNSPEGNLYASLLLRPMADQRSFGLYSFVAALALADTVRHYAPHVPVALKWPNDVLADDKKISGILIEADTDWLVIGVGLNVQRHPEDGLYPSVSLCELNAMSVGLEDVLQILLGRMAFWCDELQARSFAPIREKWLEQAKKGSMIARLPQETIAGEFVDIDAAGHLRLRLANGEERSIATGDVFVNAEGDALRTPQAMG